MGWWLGEEEKQEESTIPYAKCTECGDYKEVSKKYINKTTEEMVTICYDCGKQRYIESLMVVSAIDGFDDLESLALVLLFGLFSLCWYCY